MNLPNRKVLRGSSVSDRTLDLAVGVSGKFSEGGGWDIIYLSGN